LSWLCSTNSPASILTFFRALQLSSINTDLIHTLNTHHTHATTPTTTGHRTTHTLNLNIERAQHTVPRRATGKFGAVRHRGSHSNPRRRAQWQQPPITNRATLGSLHPFQLLSVLRLIASPGNLAVVEGILTLIAYPSEIHHDHSITIPPLLRASDKQQGRQRTLIRADFSWNSLRLSTAFILIEQVDNVNNKIALVTEYKFSDQW
jgi:hypothetical protein